MSRPQHFPSPDDVETAFYEAIVNSDTDALMSLWAEDEETLCVHPTGQQILGLASIRESWQGIFGNAQLRVQAEPVARWQGLLLAIHHLVETLFIGDDPAPHGPLHVTHVYSRGAHGWRLVSRHASAAGEQAAASDARPRVLH